MIKKLFIVLVLSIFCLLAYARISATQAQPSAELSEWQINAEIYSFKNYQINYHDSKNINKPVIVFLHGYPTSSWDWRFVWEELSNDFRLISLDMLGFGLSDKPHDIIYTISEQTDIYESLLESLAVSEAHVVAHDYGDIVAQELLARQSERPKLTVQSLVLLNGAIFPEVHEPVFVQKLLNSAAGKVLSQFNSRAIFGVSLEKVFGENSKPTKEELDDYWFLSVHNKGHLLNHKLLHYIDDRHTFRDRWVGATVTTKVPMVFVNGVADPVAGEAMVQRYIELVPNPKVVRLDNVGHFPQVEAPQAVAKAIRGFLDI